jgi:hypothetical protein
LLERLALRDVNSLAAAVALKKVCLSIAKRARVELFHVYPDQRSPKQPIEKMAPMLSRGLRKWGDKRDHPFRRVKFFLSHEHQAVQISDILIGAVADRLNRHYDRPEANNDKSSCANM